MRDSAVGLDGARCGWRTWTLTASNCSVLYPTFMLGLQSKTDVANSVGCKRGPTTTGAPTHLKTGQGRLFGAGALPPMHHEDDVEGWYRRFDHVAELPGMVSVFMRPNPAVEWRYFNDPVYDPIWRRFRTPGCRSAFHPFLDPDLPGACEGLKLARERKADGSYVSLEEFNATSAGHG